MKVTYTTPKDTFEMPEKLASLLTLYLGYQDPNTKWGPYIMSFDGPDTEQKWRGFFDALVLTEFDGATDFMARVTVFGGCTWESFPQGDKKMNKFVDITIRMPKEWTDSWLNYYLHSGGMDLFTMHIIKHHKQKNLYNDWDFNKLLVSHAKTIEQSRDLMK